MVEIFKGDSTIFADNNKFITFNIITDLDLSGWQAIFSLGGIKKVVNDISSKTFDIILASYDTSSLPLGEIMGSLKLIDKNKNVKTVTNTIPFSITDEVICTKGNTIDINIEELQCPSVKIIVPFEEYYTKAEVDKMIEDLRKEIGV